MPDAGGAGRPLLEVCVETLAGLDAAVRGGADRVELCAALAVGGLTPASSLVRAAAGAALPVHLLCRPRAGDFVYGAGEAALVAEDIRLAAEAGLAGIVIGASRPGRALDADLLARWIAHARALGDARGRPLALTLHRAFDLAPDLGAALDEAVALGFDRVLTSGGALRAADGLPSLASLHARGAGRITILAGSGVNPGTLPAILQTGVREVHASCRAPGGPAADAPERRFGFAGEGGDTDAGAVSALAAMLRDPTLHHTNL